MKLFNLPNLSEEIFWYLLALQSLFRNPQSLFLLKEMPKDMTHVNNELHQQRQTKKFSKTAYPPSKVEMKVLGTGVNGAPRSLYIFTNLKW